MKKVVIIFVLNCIINSYCIKVPTSPCPSIFSYNFNGKDWSGHIVVPAPPISANVAVISANFSIEGKVPNGKIILDEQSKATEKIKNGQNLKYIVTFPTSAYLPKVTLINYNGINLCSGSPVPPPNTNFWLQYTFKWHGVFGPYQPPVYQPPVYQPPVYQQPTSPTIIYRPQTFYSPSTFVPKTSTPIPYQSLAYQPPTSPTIINTPPALTSSSIPYRPPIQTHNHHKTTTESPVVSKPLRNYKYCGTIGRTKRNAIDDKDWERRIINGSFIPENSHPWLAAMFDLSNGNAFFCAGTLISSKHVLTAAHCTIVKKQSKIQVRLGVHNTKNLWHPGSLNRNAVSTVEHPEYEKDKAHADMAFIVLDDEVVFTKSINPICLWNFPSDFRFIRGLPGTIMGWGNQETGDPSSVPLKTEVTIETHQKCKQIDILKNLVTNGTFCAGTQGTGPCMGDSGGGLFLEMDSKWYLRGIISTSIAKKHSRICETSTYSIYVDTAKYMNWIVDQMDNN